MDKAILFLQCLVAVLLAIAFLIIQIKEGL